MRNFLMPALMLTATLSLVACSGNTTVIPPTTTNTPPVANFSITPTSGPAALTVTTTNSSTDADTGETVTLTYDVDWGDSSAHSTTPSTTHTYTTAGTYTVTLTAKDVNNATNSKTATVTVSNPAPVAPTVLSVSPANGSVGNVAGAPIVVTFSKPMDAFVTSGAYIFPLVAGTTPLTTTGSSFAWSAGNTVLTITPTTATTYATMSGTGPGTPNKYSFSINTAAKSDASAGSLALGSQLDITFSTSVQHGVALLSVASKDAAVVDVSGLNPGVTLMSTTSPADMFIGDTIGGKRIEAYLSFDLSSLPVTVLPANIVSAKLNVVYKGTVGVNPYLIPTGLGISATNLLQVNSLVYGTPDQTTVKAVSTLVTSDLDGGAINFADTTIPFKADLGARVARTNLSQYKLGFANSSNNDISADQAKIGSVNDVPLNQPKLTVDYLANN